MGVTKQYVLEHHYSDFYCFGEDKLPAHDSRYNWLVLSQQLSRSAALALVGYFVTGGEFLIASGACAALGITLFISAFSTHPMLSSSLHVLFHGLMGTANPMLYSITSQSAGAGNQGKMLGVLSFFKDVASVATPKLGMWIWSWGTEARKLSATWAAILPACVGTFCAIAAAITLFIARSK